MNKTTFQEAINRGLISGEWEQLANWVVEESNYTFKDNHGSIFDESIFERLMSLLTEPSFINSDSSSIVLKMFEYDWASLSKRQTQELRGLLTSIYNKAVDPLSWFIISELLGEYYADAEALEALKFLKHITTDNEARSLIPMGFEKMISYSPLETVKANALVELTEMKDDSSEQVRAEVDISFNRLNN